MTFRNCCIIAWHCKRYIEFTETIGFFPLPKPSSIGIRKYLLDYLVYVSTAAQCLIWFCYKYLHMLFCVKCTGRLFCDLKYWFSYHGNIIASDELRCKTASISFLLAGFFFMFLFIYNGFTNLFLFTVFTLFQKLNSYQKVIVFISSWNCFSDTEENVRMHFFIKSLQHLCNY